MSEEVKTGGAGTQESSAQEGETTTSTTQTEAEKKVGWKDHKRALDDMHKFKREAQEAAQRLASLEAERLAEKEDFKGLAEKYQKERDTYKQNLEKERGAFQLDRKYSAVKEAALKLGLRNERDLDLINLDDVGVEYTSEGRMFVNGVDEFVAQLKADRPHWFQDKSAPRFNGGGATTEPPKNEPLTARKVYELERKYRSEGKLDKVKELYEQYSKQKQATA